MPPYEVISYPTQVIKEEGQERTTLTANELASRMNDYLNYIDSIGGHLVHQCVMIVQDDHRIPADESAFDLPEHHDTEARPYVFLTCYVPERPAPEVK